MGVTFGHIDRTVPEQVTDLDQWHPGGHQPRRRGRASVVDAKILDTRAPAGGAAQHPRIHQVSPGDIELSQSGEADVMYSCPE